MTYTVPDFGPSDLLTNPRVGIRRAKVSSEPAIGAFVFDGLAYSMSGTYSIADGTKLAMNISFAADSVIASASTNMDNISLRVGDATGDAGGIVDSTNLNMLSVDDTPANAQLYYNASHVGAELAYGQGAIEPYAIAGAGNDASIFVENNTGSTRDVKIQVTFYEIGERLASFGLTASTFLEPDTEMSTYG